jgi:hypothetical protein
VTQDTGGDTDEDPVTGQTTKDLYRGGNGRSAKLDNLRAPLPDGTLRELNDDGSISPGRGPSTFENPRGAKNWWRLPAGTIIPDGVQLINDHGDHWVWSPTQNMEGADFARILSEIKGWVPVK